MISNCAGVDARERFVEESAACAAVRLLAALAAGPDEDDAPGVEPAGSRDMVLLGGDGALRELGRSELVAPL